MRIVSLRNKICTYQVRSRKLNVPRKLTEWKICISFHFLEINPLHINIGKKNMHAHLALGTRGEPGYRYRYTCVVANIYFSSNKLSGS